MSDREWPPDEAHEHYQPQIDALIEENNTLTAYRDMAEAHVARLEAMLEAALIQAGRPNYWPCSKHHGHSLKFRTGIPTMCPICNPPYASETGDVKGE